jgi:hypothetical protein
MTRLEELQDEAYDAGFADGVAGNQKFTNWPDKTFEKDYNEGYKKGSEVREEKRVGVQK